MKQLLAALLMGLALLAQADTVPMLPFGPDSMQQIEQRHHGKPFIVLVWSMDCPFCQTSLDLLAKARAANPDLMVVTITTDPLADQALTKLVQRRLESLQLQDQPWSFGPEAPEQLRFALDPNWRGEKPRTYWYDASGKRIAMSGLIKAEKLAQWQKTPAAPARKAP